MAFCVEVTKVPAFSLPEGINRALAGLHLDADYPPCCGSWVEGNFADRNLVSRTHTHGGSVVSVKEAVRALEEAGKGLAAEGLRRFQFLPSLSPFWQLGGSRKLWFAEDETKFLGWNT